MKAAVLTVSDGVSRGRRARTRAATLLEELLAGEGTRSSAASCPTSATQIAAAICELADERARHPDDRRHRARAARRHAGGDAVGDRARGTRDRRGDPRRLRSRRRRTGCSRAACRRRGQTLVVNLPGLARRLPRRLRGDEAGADARAQAARRRPHRRTSRRERAARRARRAASRRSSRSSTRSSRCRSRTSARCSPSTAFRPAHDLVWITRRDGRRALARDGAEPADRRARSTRAIRAPPVASCRRPAFARRRSRLSALASLSLFLVAVLAARPVVRWLWPIPVVGFVVYPYLKRFTWLCHFWLGAVDGLAPVGAWVAITGELPWEAWALGGAVAAWIAGFDLFYSLFDAEFDRRAGPALVGGALRRGGRVLGRARAARPDRRAARRRRGSASTSARCTGSASPRSRRCSPTSTRSCGPATSAVSTRRSSR